uniref:sensor histidine kinase n=1 Tax=Acetatifactor sp. TaxID=1872090 RepID=UPI0040578DB2
MLDFIICVLTNFFRIHLIDRFVATFLGKANVGKRKKIFICTCFYIVNTGLFMMFHTAWINIICNLAGISVIVRLYTKSVKENLFVTSSIYLINGACDVIGTLLFINYKDGEAHSQIYAAISVFLFFMCELLAEKIITTHKKTEEALHFPLIFVPLCSISVICLLIYSDACADRGMALVGIGLLIVNFFMLYLYNLLISSISQKYETEMLGQKVQIYKNQLDVILQSEEKVKALRHDMKHHLNELKVLANKYDVIEIQSYIDKMEESIHNPREIVASGNLEIDSVLNYMLQKAKEELNIVNIKVMLPEKIKHSFDINVLLGNLLENAIEAARKTDKKYLSLDIVLKKGILKIKIENSFLLTNILQTELKNGEKIYLSTKQNKGLHGIGLKNVKSIVESYNGMMDVAPQDDIFCVSLVLYM